MNKKAFTLFEIVLALIIFSMLIGIIFTTYINIKKSEWDIWNQQLVTKEANDFLDRLHDLSLDYTIDYEEYFNRYHAWCDTEQGTEFARNKNWSCVEFTEYGNNWTWDGFYYCNRMESKYISWYWSYTSLFWWLGIYEETWAMWVRFLDHQGCWIHVIWKQYYWEYKRQFWDTALNYANEPTINDWDDVFRGEWPIAIWQNTWVQELYLINQDWDNRVYFRRNYITWVDLNWDWLFTWKNESLYSIQTLKLKWFDAGMWHNFDTWYWWVHDGFIDTRACDAEAGFVCSWSIVLTGDTFEYRLPADIDDGRVDITDSRVTVSDWNFELYPAKDPYLAKNDYQYLFDPYAIVNITTNIYWKKTDEEITLQTSMSFKNSYHNFDTKELTWFLP